MTLEYIFGAESIFLTASVALASESCPVAHLPSLPRVGLRMVLPSSFSKMTWLGQGAFWGRRGLLEAVEDGLLPNSPKLRWIEMEIFIF